MEDAIGRPVHDSRVVRCSRLASAAAHELGDVWWVVNVVQDDSLGLFFSLISFSQTPWRKPI